MEIDVLVVGMGPAGSGAAKTAAEAGAKVLAIDRKKEIGSPVQCGEVIGRGLLRRAGLKLPRQAVSSCQTHTRFVVDRSLDIRNYGGQWKSVTVERKILDKLLAADAAASGAMVQADSTLISLEMDGDQVESAVVRIQGVERTVRPKVVVAADGVHSRIANMTGVCWNTPDMVAHGGEFEMVAKKPLPRCMQVFLEEEVGMGYGWIIPKGRNRANVGLAEVGVRGNTRERVQEWIEENPVVNSYFDPHGVLEVKIGDAPVPGFQGGPSKGNILFTGDAAGQTLAFVGEGIMPAYLCGKEAGRAAALQPQDYDHILREEMGDELGYGGELKDAILELWGDGDLSSSQRYIAAGLVMSEAIAPETMAALMEEGREPTPWELYRLIKKGGKRVKVRELDMR